MLLVLIGLALAALLLITAPIANSWMRRRRSQLAAAQETTIAAGGVVVVSCFLKGSAPGLPASWRQGKLLLRAGHVAWQPSRQPAEQLELPSGGSVVRTGRPAVAWNGPKPNVFDSITWPATAPPSSLPCLRSRSLWSWDP